MKLGNLEITGDLVLAPMAGVTDLAFRTICAERQIRYPRHRRKHQITRDFQISQFHAYSSKVSS